MLKKLFSTFLVLSIFTSLTVMGSKVMAETQSPMKLVSVKKGLLGDKKVVFPYKVSQGDQIAYLAKIYKTTPFAIKSLNHLKTDALTGGQVIHIPMSPSVFKEVQSKAARSLQKNTATSTTSKDSYNTAVGGAVTKVMSMKATAYGNDHGWGNKTALGTKCRPGVIAVDKKIIPLGTKVWVSGYSSPYLPKGGFMAIAEDTGVYGNKIDIYMPHSENSGAVNNFGIQSVTVKIIG